MMINEKPGILSALVVAIAAASLAGCGGSGDGSGGTAGGSSPASVIAEATSLSSTVVTLNGGVGGDGASSTGGDGGNFQLYKESGAGDVKVLASGAAAAGFVTQTFTPDFGDNGVVITANKTVTEYANCTDANAAAADTLYLVTGENSNLYKADADGVGCEGEERVTGLKVNAGVTLTLPTNYSGAAYVNFDKDVQNLGTITSVDESASQRGSIWLYGKSYIGSGKILTKGTLDGQSGGDIYAYFNYAFINSGEMNSSGANSATGNGGDAGYVDLESGYYTQNRGAIKAKGGDSAAGAGGTGGDGDYVEFYSSYGPSLNSAAVDGRGGKGDTGGSGADFYMYGEFGKAHNSGALSLQGADSVVGNGGDGGDTYFETYAGTLRNSGALLAYGGKTTDAAGSGGDGGYLEAYSYDSSLYEESPAGSINWSGRIALHGGNAVETGSGNGGDAGYVYAEIDNDYTDNADIAFMGYSQVHTFGGAGANGGDGDGYELYNYDASRYEDEAGYYNTNQGGNVISQASVKANGGGAYSVSDRANGYGGDGGYVYLESDYNNEDMADPTRSKVTHSGALNLSGGQNKDSNGAGNGGTGGRVWVWGYNGVTFTGAITANGGNDVGTTGGNANTTSYGGQSYYVEIWGELGTTRVTGNITANGGNAGYRGGSHYSEVSIYGNKIVQSGTLSHKGGNANPAVTGSVGGNGGWIQLRATNPDQSTGAASAQFGGGTGATAGSEGGYQSLVTCTGACGPF